MVAEGRSRQAFVRPRRTNPDGRDATRIPRARAWRFLTERHGQSRTHDAFEWTLMCHPDATEKPHALRRPAEKHAHATARMTLGYILGAFSRVDAAAPLRNDE